MAVNKTKEQEIITLFNLDKYPDSMTVNDLKECLNIQQSMAYRLVSSGEIKSFGLGKRNKRLSKQSVIKYIERNMNT